MSMGFAKLLNKPEYLHNPFAVIRKLFKPSGSNQLFTTRWQTKIVADWQDAIGGSIGLFGIYDLETTELLWRLIQPGNFVLDIGANIGYMTGLCSYKVGEGGKVWAFEPNPLLLSRLRGNIARTKFQNIRLFEVGLSDKTGNARLVLPRTFSKNAGIAYVAPQNEPIREDHMEIALMTLDSVIPKNVVIDVMKIDVEGHELAVFNGAGRMFTQKKIRHIIFEDLHEQPSDAAHFLSRHGYTIFRIEKKLNRLKLMSPSAPVSYKKKTTNYIATLDVDTVFKATSAPGYKCLMRFSS